MDVLHSPEQAVATSYNPLSNISSVPPCFGCGACANACPTGAIFLRLNDSGFLEPRVNESACVSCGLCKKVCLKLNPPADRQGESSFYAGWSKNKEQVLNCSSGGICGEAATSYIKQGHIVYGAVWDRTGIAHIRIDNLSDLPRIFQSKYGQSNTGDTYKQALHDLREGRKVLYTGTPCQIAGLKRFLGKEYENLLTIDIVCHGTPTRLLEEKFLSELERDNGMATRVSYRDKTHGWRSYSHVVKFEGGKEYKSGCFHDIWMRGFISDIALGESCYSCPYHIGTYQSDMTCGDCWGASKLVHPFWNHKNGISIISTHTEKGKQFLLNLPVQLHKVTPEKARGLNPGLNKQHTDIPLKRESYIQALRGTSSLKGINQEYLNGFRQKYDVAILGMWMGTNYGGLLTSYALYRTVRDMGYSTVLLDHQYCYPYNDHTNVFWSFIHREHPAIAAAPTLRSLKAATDGIETLLVGSDQVWNPYCGYQHYFYLDFAKPEHKKIAYASSFGNSLHMYQGEYRVRAEAYLQRFDAISTREEQGVDILNNHFGVGGAKHTLDPVFLKPASWWHTLASHGRLHTSGRYLLAYILNSTPEKQAAIASAARERGIGNVLYIFDGARKKDLDSQDGLHVSALNGIDVYSWLQAIRDAELVITDSFHGSCFSIIFKKQFFALGNTTRGLDRFTSLAKQFHIQHTLREETNATFPLECNINYEKVEQTLERLRKESIDWLACQLAATNRSETLQNLNKETADMYPPFRMRKEEISRFLRRKIPGFYAFQMQVKQKLSAKIPRLYGILRNLKRKLF